MYAQENKSVPLIQVIEKIESGHNYKFFFNPDSIRNVTVDLTKSDIDNLKLYFNSIDKTKYTLTVVENYFVFLSPNKQIKYQIDSSFFNIPKIQNNNIVYQTSNQNFLETQQEYVVKELIVGNTKEEKNKSIVNLTGIITDANSGTPIIGATVYIKELGKGDITGANGNFYLKIPKGEYSLVVNSLDKKEEKFKLILLSSGKINITLKPKLIALEEVVVNASKFDKVQSTSMGMERLTKKEFNEIPVVLGEQDILKVAQMLPGVQSIGEGSAGLYVRGSSADQNLFYYNNIPVYNANHLFGFFSAFPSETIEEFKLYKSHIPVEFGGRIASVFDISTKKGNRNKFHSQGGISPISAGISIETPIIKDRASFLFSGRTTYSDWILKRISNAEIRNSTAYFGDLASSFTWELNGKNQFEIFGYYSKDRVDYNQEIANDFSNEGFAFRWSRLIREKHNLTTTVVNSKYNFKEVNKELVYDSYQHQYQVNHSEIKSTLDLKIGAKHYITAGVNGILYNLDRGEHERLEGELVVQNTDVGKEQGIEAGIFIADEWQITPELALSAGLRYNIYTYLGPQNIYLYSPTYIKTPDNISDSISFSKNHAIKTYHRPDIRLSFKYSITPKLSIKGSYNQMQQNIFMLSNTISINPSDKWKLADYHIKPMVGDQLSTGIYTNILNFYEFTIEGFYKRTNNYLEYKDGANLQVNPNLETEILQGNHKAHGVEIMLRKVYGKFTGWANYTYTKTTVTIDSEEIENKVNNGVPFPASYDKPHSVNVVGNFRASRRLSLSANLVYASGRPYTSPVGVYYLNGNTVVDYSARNELRIPDYFRIDASINLDGNLRKNKPIHSSWMLSVYNLTGRKNAYSVYFTSDNGYINGYKYSIFGNPIITLTFKYKLGNYDN